eukprot:971677-Prorocentrum_minimum.AAC.1
MVKEEVYEVLEAAAQFRLREVVERLRVISQQRVDCQKEGGGGTVRGRTWEVSPDGGGSTCSTHGHCRIDR